MNCQNIYRQKQFSEAEKILYACIKLKQNNLMNFCLPYLQLAQNYLRQHKTENAHKYFALKRLYQCLRR